MEKQLNHLGTALAVPGRLWSIGLAAQPILAFQVGADEVFSIYPAGFNLMRITHQQNIRPYSPPNGKLVILTAESESIEPALNEIQAP
ncbi:hypothetical protein GGU11DRAFT_740738 [Lentinula aff. detonsa]|nr:hypothetical protein GGU11DRAFT_740738 [Lentinula aff. detonsa]